MYGILQLLLFEAQIPQIRHVVVGHRQERTPSVANGHSSIVTPQQSFMKSLTHICTCRPRLSLHFRPSFPLCHISFYSLLSLSNFFADNVSRTWNHYFHKDTVFENTKKDVLIRIFMPKIYLYICLENIVLGFFQTQLDDFF